MSAPYALDLAVLTSEVISIVCHVNTKSAMGSSDVRALQSRLLSRLTEIHRGLHEIHEEVNG